MYQKTTIVGFLGKNVELKTTPNGNEFAKFPVSTSRKYRDSSGERKEETCWFNVTAWGKLAEVCDNILAKGDKVLIEGQLAPDDSGNPKVWGVPAKATYDLRCITMVKLSSKAESRERIIALSTSEALEDGIQF